MIPSTLHQIWIGPKKMPEGWMQTWREKNSSMEYQLWREEDIDAFDLEFKDKVDGLMSIGRYSIASDIIRVEILNRLGGVYIDADSVCLQSIEDAPFMDSSFFIGLDYDDRRGEYKNRLANGTIGSVPNHPILVEMIERMKNIPIERYWDFGGRLVTECIGKNDAVVLPVGVFLPKNWDGRRAPEEEKVYAAHYWGTTKGKY